jgi:hypothetical protein
MKRVLLVPISLGALTVSCSTPPTVASATTARAQGQALTANAAMVNPVIQWNRVLLRIVRTPGAQPKTIHPTRSFAMMHAAIYDAVNSIDRTHTPYLVAVPDASHSASQDAAAASAAHDVLIALYPAQTTQIDSALQQSLAEEPGGTRKVDGVAIGRQVAARILDARRNDGSNATPPVFVFGTAPGDYQSTPPNFPPQPQFTHWSHVTPFALEQASQFRPGPPPSLTSDTYTDGFNEVKASGIANSTSATADQALTGKFWNGAIQNYWNEIAQSASLEHGLTTAGSARLFAQLDLAVADGVIAFYDAKYSYNFWRPVTAIRAAATDGNPQTAADTTWLPEVGTTTPDPSYPGAHAVISGAAERVLRSFFRTDRLELTVTSEVMPGAVRSFTTISAAADEATLSRIFAGAHFRFDLTAGHHLGQAVADAVIDRRLIPLHDDGRSDR